VFSATRSAAVASSRSSFAFPAINAALKVVRP
jgi:hypothetical protein